MATYPKALMTVTIGLKTGGDPVVVADTATSNNGHIVWEAIKAGKDVLYMSDETTWRFISRDCICGASAVITDTEVEKPEDAFCQAIADPCAEDSEPENP